MVGLVLSVYGSIGWSALVDPLKHGISDPPKGVGGEVDPTSGIKSLGGFDQALAAFYYQFLQG